MMLLLAWCGTSARSLRHRYVQDQDRRSARQLPSQIRHKPVTIANGHAVRRSLIDVCRSGAQAQLGMFTAARSIKRPIDPTGDICYAPKVFLAGYPRAERNIMQA